MHENMGKEEMDGQQVKEKRSYVRADFSFRVELRMLSTEEYRLMRKRLGHGRPEKALMKFGDTADEGFRNTAVDPCLVDFLVHMDEKLDRILARLSGATENPPSANDGTGLNIGGDGMMVRIDHPVDLGQIVQASLFLSRMPLVFMDLFGEVIRVEPVTQGGRTFYHTGIRFLDIDINDREKIISCVFQSQREAIRKKRFARVEEG